jgi:AraC-like DNA-binding protein
MDGRFGDRIDLAALSQAAGCSAYHFLRSFTAAYGETPARYLTRRRVERAAELLRGANLNVTEVCQRVGFSSLGTFSARFKELMGAPPSAYQRDMRASGGPPPIPGCFVLMHAISSAAKVSNLEEAPDGDRR